MTLEHDSADAAQARAFISDLTEQSARISHQVEMSEQKAAFEHRMGGTNRAQRHRKHAQLLRTELRELHYLLEQLQGRLGEADTSAPP